MGGPFDWGKSNKESSDKGGNLPRHIERMDMGTRPPKMKNSGDGNNLPWGGQPKEAEKAYMSGLPKNKGSMMSKTGQRKATEMPNSGKALSGHTPMVKSKAQPAGMKKGKK